MVLDVLDFQPEKGGDLKKLKESQRRRYAPEAVIDDIVNMFEDHKKTQYAVTQINAQITALKKEIGPIMKAKGDASELLSKRATLEKEKKTMEDSAAEKNLMLQRKLKTVGNYVHDSVLVSDNEVSVPDSRYGTFPDLSRITIRSYVPGSQKMSPWRSETVCLITRS
jgi:seryl-tRNA synthetase